MSRYWASVRPYYKGVDKGDPFPNTEVYDCEMPGGQFSNLKQQLRPWASVTAGTRLRRCTMT